MSKLTGDEINNMMRRLDEMADEMRDMKALFLERRLDGLNKERHILRDMLRGREDEMSPEFEQSMSEFEQKLMRDLEN